MIVREIRIDWISHEISYIFFLKIASDYILIILLFWEYIFFK